MARKKKFQNGGRASPYNPMLHMTDPAEAERQRIAGNKAARKRRMPTQEQDDYWWSGLTRPVDEVLRKALGPAASSLQGVLDLVTPARSIAEVANKPTAENIIHAAADTAATAGGLKALTAPAKAAQKVNRTIPKASGGDDMSKYTVAKSLFGAAKDALTKGKGTPKGGKPKPTRAEKVAAENKKAQELAKKRAAAQEAKKTPKSTTSAKVRAENKKAQELAKKRMAAQEAKKTSQKKDDVIYGGAPQAQAQLPKPKPVRGTDQTSGPTIRAGDRLGGATPAVRRPTTPAKTKSKTSSTSKDKGKIVGLSPLGKAIAGGTLGAGAIYGGTKLADNYYSKEAGATPAAKPPKKAQGSKATINKAPYVEGYDMDMDDFDSPKSVPSKSTPKAKTDPDFEYYGKEGTGLGDFSRKHGIQYATEEGYKKWFDTHDGEKAGGRPGKGKMKTQGMNKKGKRKAGFSGRGAGAALRGF